MFFGSFGIGLLLPSLHEPEKVRLTEPYHPAQTHARQTAANQPPHRLGADAQVPRDIRERPERKGVISGKAALRCIVPQRKRVGLVAWTHCECPSPWAGTSS